MIVTTGSARTALLAMMACAFLGCAGPNANAKQDKITTPTPPQADPKADPTQTHAARS